MLGHASMQHKSLPILVLANKVDLPHSLPAEAVAEQLGLADAAKQHTWKVAHCCGLDGRGVREGWDWLMQQMTRL